MRRAAVAPDARELGEVMGYDPMNYTPNKNSLPAKVLAFFVDNPDEELTSLDVAGKFGVTPSGAASQKLAHLVIMGLLSSLKIGRHLHYTAGPMLAQWAGEPASVVAVPAGKAAQKTARPEPLEIRLTLHIYGFGTPGQRVEMAGVEP